MSYLDTKQALVQKLINAAIVPNADIAFENRSFDPANKDKWLACYFIPATEETTGKTVASSDEQRGIFQVSTFIKKNSINFDNEQLSLIDEVKAAFTYSDNTVYNGQQVDILEATVNNGFETESWFQRDISINYLTFSTRI